MTSGDSSQRWRVDGWLRRRGLLVIVVLAVWAVGIRSFSSRVRHVEERADVFSDMGDYQQLRGRLSGVASAGFVSQMPHRQKGFRQFFTAQYVVFPTVLVWTSSKDRNFAKMARRLLQQEAWICYCEKKAFRSKLLAATGKRARRLGLELEVAELGSSGLLVVQRVAATEVKGI